MAVIQQSARARVVGIDTQFKDLRGSNVSLLPQHVGVVGQGATLSTYSTDKTQFSSALEVGQTYGFGSPIHLVAKQLFPVNGGGVGTIPVTFFPLEDDGSGVASAGDITPAGTQTEDAAYIVKINEIASEEFVISAGDSVATRVTAITDAISAILDEPMIAVDGTTVVDLTSKWEGTSANDLFIVVEGSTTAGTTFAITQPAGGLVNPDVDVALDQFGDIWYTLLLNCMDIADTTTLDKFETVGEGRWGNTVNRPFMTFTGNPATSVANAIVIPDARKTERINAQLVAPGSENLPFIVAARQLVEIALLANEIPPHDYGSRPATGLVPGTDAEQWTFAERDQAIKAGSSSIQVRDGVINLSDTITFFHPTGDDLPAYRYVVDVIKVFQVIFNTSLIFDTPEWDGAPLLPDDQPTIEPTARKPKHAVARVAGMIDGLGLRAIISDPEAGKLTIVATINSLNPKRLDIGFTLQISGNTNIISVGFNFGFFFGTPAIVA